MKQTFLKQLSSVRTNNLVIAVLMESLEKTALEIRQNHSKKGRRALARIITLM
jgi:hypothetical protein